LYNNFLRIQEEIFIVYLLEILFLSTKRETVIVTKQKNRRNSKLKFISAIIILEYLITLSSRIVVNLNTYKLLIYDSTKVEETLKVIK